MDVYKACVTTTSILNKSFKYIFYLLSSFFLFFFISFCFCDCTPILYIFQKIIDSYQVHTKQLIIECKMHDKSKNSSISWLKDNVPIEPDKKYSLIEHENGTKQLIISNPTRNDNGLYSCRGIHNIDKHIENISHYVDISDKLSNDQRISDNDKKNQEDQQQQMVKKDKGIKMKRKSSKTEIDADVDAHQIQHITKIRFESQLKNVNIEEGGSIKLLCNVRGDDLQIIWLLNNTPITIANDAKYKSSINHGFIMLEIFDTCAKDSGDYTCIIKNRRNEVQTTATVNVFGKSNEYNNSLLFSSSIKGIIAFIFLISYTNMFQYIINW